MGKSSFTDEADDQPSSWRTPSSSESTFSKDPTVPGGGERDTLGGTEIVLREKVRLPPHVLLIRTPADALATQLMAAERRLADLEGFYVSCAMQPSGVLDKRLLVSGPKMAMQGVSGASALWTSTPISAMLSKGWAGCVSFRPCFL